eukprot:Anaeramoba_flamelloidesa1053913_264.p1 GENE.a1053913_264~~a1053913_264.p1  ORF type:complete len:154 (-),score=50.81 a1053913_264:42-482(-)
MSKWNVGGYHWEEINLNKWAKERLEDLLTTEDLDLGSFEGGVMKLKSAFVTGDAYINVRRGKRIPGWDLTLKVKVKGHILEEEKKKKKFNGTLEIRNVAEGEEEDEYIVNPTCEENLDTITDFLKKKLLPKVLEQIRVFIKELREK